MYTHTHLYYIYYIALPNNVIPKDSVLCFNWALYRDGPKTYSAANKKHDPNQQPVGYNDTEWLFEDQDVFIHNRFTLAFPENPGRLREMKINKFLDGNRPTLFSYETGDERESTVGWHIYANGFTGEFVDYVDDLCGGVLIKLDGLQISTGYHILNPIDEIGEPVLAAFKVSYA